MKNLYILIFICSLSFFGRAFANNNEIVEGSCIAAVSGAAPLTFRIPVYIPKGFDAKWVTDRTIIGLPEGFETKRGERVYVALDRYTRQPLGTVEVIPNTIGTRFRTQMTNKGRGYGSEVTYALMHTYLITQPRLTASINDSNKAAINLYTKLGFHRVGPDETEPTNSIYIVEQKDYRKVREKVDSGKLKIFRNPKTYEAVDMGRIEEFFNSIMVNARLSLRQNSGAKEAAINNAIVNQIQGPSPLANALRKGNLQLIVQALNHLSQEKVFPASSANVRARFRKMKDALLDPNNGMVNFVESEKATPENQKPAVKVIF